MSKKEYTSLSKEEYTSLSKKEHTNTSLCMQDLGVRSNDPNDSLFDSLVRFTSPVCMDSNCASKRARII
jgi:hypothetical protein